MMKDALLHMTDIFNEEIDLFLINFNFKIYLIDCEHSEDIPKYHLQLLVICFGEDINWIETYFTMFEIDEVVLFGEAQRHPLWKLLQLYRSKELVARFC